MLGSRLTTPTDVVEGVVNFKHVPVFFVAAAAISRVAGVCNNVKYLPVMLIVCRPSLLQAFVARVMTFSVYTVSKMAASSLRNNVGIERKRGRLLKCANESLIQFQKAETDQVLHSGNSTWTWTRQLVGMNRRMALPRRNNVIHVAFV